MSEIKKHTPVDTGDMRNSIKVTSEEMDGSFIIHVNKDYASFIEFGTSTIKVGTIDNPRKTWKAKQKRGDAGPSTMPFIMPTVYKNQKNILKIIKRHISEAFAV